MAVPSVPELLQPLNARLSDIEGQRISPHDSYNFKNVLIPLDKNLLILEPKEVVPVIAKMQRLIEDIFDKKIEDYTVNGNENDKDLPFGNTVKEIYEAVTNELKYYQGTLDQLFKRMMHGVVHREAESKTPAVEKCIELPEGFTFDIIQKHFDQKIYNVNQAALLLHFLRKESHIPQYSDVSLSTIGETLFGWSKKSLRLHLNKVQHYDKVQEDIKSLKAILTNLIDEIDGEIEQEVEV